MITIEKANEILKERIKETPRLDITPEGVYKLTEDGRTIIDSDQMENAFKLNNPSKLVLYKPFRRYVDRVIISKNRSEKELKIVANLMEVRAQEFISSQIGDILVFDYSFQSSFFEENYVRDCGDDILELRYHMDLFKL